MKISQKGIDLITQFEGCKLQTYLCPAGVLTIGYGHTGKDVHPGMEITHEEAENILFSDLVKYEKAIDQFVFRDLTQCQFDALVSFVFNIGVTAFVKSTLLKCVNVNPDDEKIGIEFMRWIRGGGKVLNGLVARREAETKLYFTPSS